VGTRPDSHTQAFMQFRADQASSCAYKLRNSGEKTSAFRTEKRRDTQTGATFPWLVRRSAMVNRFYFYGFDADFGPFFIKFATYFPYNAKVCLNGHHYAQQQAHATGIAFQALDNGLLSADDPTRLQRICDDLGPRAHRRVLPQVAQGAAAPVQPR
jgi:hypothetical protein